MIVHDDAFEELLDHAALMEEEGAARGGDEGEARRRRFAIAVDRAVKRAARHASKELFFEAIPRFGCRLFFQRVGEHVVLVACRSFDHSGQIAAS